MLLMMMRSDAMFKSDYLGLGCMVFEEQPHGRRRRQLLSKMGSDVSSSESLLAVTTSTESEGQIMWIEATMGVCQFGQFSLDIDELLMGFGWLVVPMRKKQ